MKFGQRISIREKMKSSEFARGIWNPTRREWRDIIESYIRISRKFRNNKLAMFKLQLWILLDLISESEALLKYKEEVKALEQKKKEGPADEKQCDIDLKSMKSEIESIKLTCASLREVVDGIVWRYFDYNRAILYILADKQPIDVIRQDKGLMNSLYELGDLFLNPNDKAILNDISNFLRTGDVTSIKADGTIEIIEVKSSRRRRGGRITRQKQRMEEIVKFINTGIIDYDGKKKVIRNSKIRQKNYLKHLKDSIRRARSKGYDSVLIGSHLIVEVVDFGKSPIRDTATNYFETRHKSVRETWQKNNNFVVPCWFIEKLEYSKNYAPYTIFPFDDDICADIVIGKIWVRCLLNYSEVMRIIRKAGWHIVDSIFTKSQKELENSSVEDMPLCVARKENRSVPMPAPWFGKLAFEMLSPSVLVDELNALYSLGPPTGNEMYLTNYVDDQSIWN